MTLALAEQNQSRGNYDEANRLYLQVLEQEPENIEANFGLGLLYFTYKRHGLAEPRLEKVVELDPEHFNGRLVLSELYYHGGSTAKVLNVLKPLRLLAGQDLDKLVNLAIAYKKLGQLELATDIYLRALEVDENQAKTHCKLGSLYRERGLMDLALTHLRRAIELDEYSGQAHFLLAAINKHTADSAEITHMEAVLERSDTLESQQKMYLSYGLGKAYEDIGRYPEAFALYLEANRIEGLSNPYRPRRAASRFSNIKEVFTREFFHSHTRMGSQVKTPIFIVGMPRSGTSLAEQILASHPLVWGGGELPDMHNLAFRIQTLTSKPFPRDIDTFNRKQLSQMAAKYLSKIRAMSGNFQRVTDKMPDNFFYIGLITVLFPNAKIIHCRRDPMDTCLSIFRNSFGASHSYSHNLATLGEYYNKYLDLMDHWNTVLPFRIYNVDYEELVGSPEEEIRALLNFCELPFNQSCLKFYETDRAVNTVSANQVRQPIFRESVDSWKRFEHQLQPLAEKLRCNESTQVAAADSNGR